MLALAADDLLPLGREDIRFIDYGTDKVLYDPKFKRVHALNLTAHAIWRCCDGSTTLRNTLLKLRAEFAQVADDSELEAHVHAALAHFREKGLLV